MSVLLAVAGIARRQGLFTTAAAVFSDESDHHAEVEFGRSLRVTLEELGGVYVKLGQILSTRPDVLPPASPSRSNAGPSSLALTVPSPSREGSRPHFAANSTTATNSPTPSGSSDRSATTRHSMYPSSIPNTAGTPSS